MSLAEKLALKKAKEAAIRQEEEKKIQVLDISTAVEERQDHDITTNPEKFEGILCPVCKDSAGEYSVKQTVPVPGGLYRVRECKKCGTKIETIEKFVQIKPVKTKKVQTESSED